MATHAATRNISGLARALAQSGMMTEYEAETLQNQAQSANVTFVEQVLLGKRMTAQQLAVFASRAFGTPLLDLNGFDMDQIHKDYVDLKIAQARRVLPLYRRSNKLFVAVSDPANLQALDEVRFVAEDENRTRVTLEHRHLDRHGDGWEGLAMAMTSEARQSEQFRPATLFQQAHYES